LKVGISKKRSRAHIGKRVRGHGKAFQPENGSWHARKEGAQTQKLGRGGSYLRILQDKLKEGTVSKHETPGGEDQECVWQREHN